MTSHRRRLAQDHAALRTGPPADYFFPSTPDGTDDLSSLSIHLAGPTQTPFESGVFNLHLRIPPTYPHEPPKACFKTKIFHPNVDERTGDVCVDTLKRDWKPALTLKDVLITIRCLLVYPNPTSSLNEAAGKLLLDDYEAYARHARLMTGVHAGADGELKEQADTARKRGEEEKKPRKIKQAVKPTPRKERGEKDDDEGGDSGKENAERPSVARQPSPLGKRSVAEGTRCATGDEEKESGRKSPKLREGQSANTRPPTTTTKKKKDVKKPAAKKIGLKRF